MYALDKERAKSFPTIKSIWQEEPPVRIAIAALLYSGYSHLQAFDMMAEHYNLSEDEYWRNVKLYSLQES